MLSSSVSRTFKSLGLNYLWGLINFTVGVAAGGIVVASILVTRM